MSFFQNVRSIWKSLRSTQRQKAVRRFSRPVQVEALEVRTLLAAAFAEFVDPHPAPGNQFGQTVTPLSTGNVVVTSPYDDAGGTDAGAVYLFNGATGALISTLRGSSAGDRVGGDGVTVLSNGNFVIGSPTWNNGVATEAGAVTWGSGITGVSGVVSAANSLVGSSATDRVGLFGSVTALNNGNYVVNSDAWNNGAVSDVGAVTWGSGTIGVTGVVSPSNSLVGSQSGDYVGRGGVTALSNGNYVVASHQWSNGATFETGAVTLGNGVTGIIGTVNPANSLVGTTASDRLGFDGVTALSNGNYVVRSLNWDNGAVTNAGAVTWGSGTTGVIGALSAANSLVGTTANDQVGSDGVTALSNGNYVVNSPNWDNGATTDAGAVTWGSGTTGVNGAVSAINSLVGTTVYNRVGSDGVTVLSNGNYVVSSSDWDNGAANQAGAVTWGSGTTGAIGAVSAANSLVGTTANNYVGGYGVAALSNGNYVVRSPNWDNGGATEVGAVTWGNGTTGISGAVSAANSLVGTTAGDFVGLEAVTILSNSNYVVRSANWDNGAADKAGAVTWGNGTTGISGPVSAANSLVGTTANDEVGAHGVTPLSNGNYVVTSSNWDNGAADKAGAVTWGNGITGISGAVSAANSLVGTTAFDQVGNFGAVTALSNGNYVVASVDWNNGATADVGAVTWGNGTTGISGPISLANSLVGTNVGDRVGNHVVALLSNGNYVVSSESWDNVAAVDAGAVTWGRGTTGVTGVVSAANSLVGTTANDRVGIDGALALSNGNYVVRNRYWDNGAMPEAGAVTWGSGTTGVSGAVSAVNSAVGLTANTSLQSVVVDNVNQTMFGRFITEGGGKVRVGSQTSGFSNNPPLIGGTLANQAVNDNSTLAPFSSATITDPDQQAEFVRVTILNGVVRGDFTPASATGWTRTVAGNDIRYERYYAAQANNAALVQTAVRALNFQPRSNAISPGMTELTDIAWYLTDGQASATVTTRITTTSVNDTPVIGGAVPNQTMNDTQTRAVFSMLTVTDPDTNPMSAQVTILNGVVRGDFTPGTTTGWTRTVSGNNIRYARTYASAANIGATVQAAIRGFVFQPRANAIKPNTTETTAFTVTVTDGIASPVSNTTTSMITTSLNNAPTLGGTTANVAVNDNATVTPFTALTVADADLQEMLISVTILNGVVRGDFTPASTVGWATRYTTGNDITYKRYFSPQANVGAAAQAAFRALVFQPRQNAINPGTTEATDFLVTVSDGVAPAVLGTGTRVTTTSVNNFPAISGAIAGQPMNDNQSRAIFNTVTITDADTDDMNVIITIPNGVNRGDFTAATTTDLGWTRTVVGVDIRYNRYFGPQANIGSVVQPYVNAIIFRPRNNVPIGTTETTGFTIFLNDGLVSTSNNTTSVITTGVAPRPASSITSEASTIAASDITTVVLPSLVKPSVNHLARLLKKPR